MGHCENQALVIYDKSDVEKLDPARKTFVLCQTTVSAEWFQERIEWIKSSCRDVEVQVENTLCRFVGGRDRDLETFAKEVDVVIMVGGTKSSNTKVLFGVCQEVNERSYSVVTEDEIDFAWFQPDDVIGVTGSASTPHWLLERVRNFIAERSSAEIVENV